MNIRVIHHTPFLVVVAIIQQKRREQGLGIILSKMMVTTMNLKSKPKICRDNYTGLIVDLTKVKDFL